MFIAGLPEYHVQFDVGNSVWSNHNLKTIEAGLKVLRDIVLPEAGVLFGHSLVDEQHAFGKEGSRARCRIKDLHGVKQLLLVFQSVWGVLVYGARDRQFHLPLAFVCKTTFQSEIFFQ